MNIRDAALATATFKALSDLIKEKDQAVRQLMIDTLLDSYADFGVKSLDVKLPDGTTVVASISLIIPKGKGAVVTDNQAFIAWVKDNYPTAIYRAPQPGPVVSPSWAERFLEGLEAAGTDAVDRGTGEIVPGVEIADAPPPKSFTVRFKPEGRDQLIAAWQASLREGSTFPALAEGE